MKTIAISLMLLSLSVMSFAQTGNGGQSAGNTAVRIEVSASKPGKIVVTNLLSCSADIDVKFNNTITTHANLAASDTFEISFAPTDQVSVKSAKSDCKSGDNGWVELVLQTTRQVLPIKFESVDYKWLSPRQLQVTFKVAESSGKNEYHVRASYDGVTWVDKYVLFPETTQPNSTYVTKINF